MNAQNYRLTVNQWWMRSPDWAVFRRKSFLAGDFKYDLRICFVADSTQFSAATSELADREYVGTALTLQTTLGLLLTLITIRLIPTQKRLVAGDGYSRF